MSMSYVLGCACEARKARSSPRGHVVQLRKNTVASVAFYCVRISSLAASGHLTSVTDIRLTSEKGHFRNFQKRWQSSAYPMVN
eukprot:scaffold47269_cov19-Prasinocladus_malaysianus.AAC.1